MRPQMGQRFSGSRNRRALGRVRRIWNLCCLAQIHAPGGDRLACISIRGEIHEIRDLIDRTTFPFGLYGFRLRKARKTGRRTLGGRDTRRKPNQRRNIRSRRTRRNPNRRQRLISKKLNPQRNSIHKRRRTQRKPTPQRPLPIRQNHTRRLRTTAEVTTARTAGLQRRITVPASAAVTASM